MDLSEPQILNLPGHPDYISPEKEHNRIKENVQIIMDGLGDTPQTPKRRVTKIKAKRGKTEEITITYEVNNSSAKGGYFTTTLTCNEEAVNEFYTLLDKALPILIQTIGLNEEIWLDAQVIGLSIKHDLEEGLGITITGKCEIDGGYPCPTSPYFIAKESTADLIREIETEALKYVDGARRQKSLF